MTVRRVLKMGDPDLLRVSEPVKVFDTPELDELIADLWDTMEAEGGVGIAAPQIGVAQRVVVFGLEESERYPEAPPVPRTVLINPEIDPVGNDSVDGWEGCLSVPGMRGVVPRFLRIRYSGFDAKGRRFEHEVEDFHARVVQHECDHLDGILYPMRIQDMRLFGFESELIVHREDADEIRCEV
jgi:peptide deformylase